MKRFVVKGIHISLFFLLIMECAAQEAPVEFGSVSVEELEMKVCSLDTSAAAVILFKKGRLVWNPLSTSGTTIFIHNRIKILKADAIDEWSNVKFTVARGSFSKLKASTYNLAGGKVVESKLNSEGTYKRRSNKYADDISFTFPNVRVGSVIEYSYTLSYKSLYLPTWTFQGTIPTLWNEYSISIPSTDFVADIRGTLPLKYHEKKQNDKFQRWVMVDVPAFKSEPLMPEKTAYLSHINFWKSREWWTSIHIRMLGNPSFWGIIKGNDFLSSIVKIAVKNSTDSVEMVRLISEHVKNNVKWNGEEDFFADKPLTVLERREGTAGDINLLLASLLAKAGFKVNMVLISTRDNGYLSEDYPSLNQFNYVVCVIKINGKHFALDATEKNLPFDMLPMRCYNQSGFMINESIFQWISLRPTRKARSSITANLAVTEAGELQGKVSVHQFDYGAYEARTKYFSLGEEEYLKRAAAHQSWSITKSEILNADSIALPVVEEHEITAQNHVIVSSDFMYVNPYVGLEDISNPFLTEKRAYPIDFIVPMEEVFLGTITLPDGYKVESMPENKIMVMPENAAKGVFNFSHVGNKVSVSAIISINKTYFETNEYPSLREFHARFIAKLHEPIVLKKNK